MVGTGGGKVKGRAARGPVEMALAKPGSIAYIPQGAIAWGVGLEPLELGQDGR